MNKRTGSNGFLVLLGVGFLLNNGLAQDKNFIFPIDVIENKLRHENFEVLGFVGARFDNDFTKRATLKFTDGAKFKAKWKMALKGGDAPNNSPRYEIAAYEFQKLFLEPECYCVPPTVGRSLPLEEYRKLNEEAEPTFSKSEAVFFVLQYWLKDVTSHNVYDRKRFKNDLVYAKHLANMNIFTYLIKHMDSNVGNFLVSIYGADMRVFSVDNSLAFGDKKSNRGTDWKKMRVKRVPQETIDRLRQLSAEDLQKTLGVVAQFEIKGDDLVPVAPTANLNKNLGVRTKDNIVQFGLTDKEIKGVNTRLASLLKRVDSGKFKTFSSLNE